MNLQKVACALAAVGMLISGAFADSKTKKPAAKEGGAPDMQAMMAAAEKAATPGEHHKQLQAMVGTWNVASKMWMGPGKPTESTGTAEYKSVMGDRFVEEHFTGTFMGKPFTGMGLNGYDNAKQKFVSTWVDSMGTGVMMSEGTAEMKDKVTTITMTGEETDPQSGKAHTVKMVLKVESDKKHTMEMFEPSPDGKGEMKVLEIVYTRK